jgi:hypothetical protein
MGVKKITDEDFVGFRCDSCSARCIGQSDIEQHWKESGHTSFVRVNVDIRDK